MYSRSMLFLLVIPLAVFGQRDAKIPDPDPEVERKTFKLPEGFEANLFAADPQLLKPIQMTFDASGRLWLACSENYPQIKPGQKHSDKIIVLDDTDGDGKADRTTVFADGLLIPTGLEPGDGGCYVVDSTDLLHLSDTDGDGKADKRRVVLSGFGTEDTHHMVHSLRWGPDGQLYFNQSIYIHSHIETPHGVRRLNAGGIWMLRPETLRLEVFARGWINSWGHHFDRYGQSFATDGAGGEGVNYVVPGASYPTAYGTPREPLHGLNPGSPKYCGCEIVSGRHLPDDWQGNLITNDFRSHRVCRFVLREDGTGYAAQLKDDVIRSSHPAFRPVDVKMGPDGAIYIADWYNPIIQHGEVDFRDPRRDKTHGRIWRITHKKNKLVPRPKLVGAPTAELLEHLKAPEDWTRHFARRVLKERHVHKQKGWTEVARELGVWSAKLDPQDEATRLEALWTFQSIDIPNEPLLKSLLAAKDHRVRAAAARVAGAWLDRVKNPIDMLEPLVTDSHPRVRMEAVRALAGAREPRAAEVALRALGMPTDKFLDYALWLTARDLQPLWLPALQEGRFTFGGDVQSLTFALKAAGSAAGIRPLVDLLRAGKVPAEREENVLALIAALGNPQDLRLVFDLVLGDTKPARKVALLEGLALATRQRSVRPPGDLGKLTGLMALRDDAVQMSAARLAGLWRLEEARARLTEIALAGDTALSVRQAACEALVGIKGKGSVETLLSLADAKRPFEVKTLAVTSLANLDLASAARIGVEVLSTAPGSADPAELITGLLNQKGGAEALAAALANRKLPADVAKIALRTARSSGREVKELGEALRKAGGLTTPVRTLSKPQLDELLDDIAKKGSASRGEAVYRRKDLSCLKCHAIAGAGGQVGPDMTSIGASAQLDYLVESMLQPGAKIKEGYHSLIVTTDAGKILTGVKVRETGKDLILRNADDKEIVIPKDRIEETKNGGSLMPEGQTDELTRGELIDVIRFLSELGKVGPYQVGKERLVRRWLVLEPGPQAVRGLIRDGNAAGATDAPWQVWASAYTTVGGLLPVEDVPAIRLRRELERTTHTHGVARAQFEVTTPGKVKLAFSSVTGLELWLDGKPLESGKELIVDLASGTHTLTVGFEREKRKEPLRLELFDVPGSAAQVRIVGGK